MDNRGEVERPPTCCTRFCGINVRIALAVTGVIVGIIAIFCFAHPMKNWDAVIWGAISGVFAGMTLYLHIRYKRGTLVNEYPRLKGYMLTGCLVQLAGACACVSYLSVAGALGQGISGDAIYGRNYWIAAVWGFMTWKWGFQLFYFARDYKREFERTFSITENKIVPNFDTVPRDPATA